MDARTLRDEFKEQIRTGLTDADLVNYDVFLPKRLSKKTTKSLRKTLHLIAFNALDAIKKSIHVINAEVMTGIAERAKEKKIASYIECINKLLVGLDQLDMAALFKDKIFEKTLAAIDEVLKSRSLAISGELAGLFNELRVWLEGLWVHGNVAHTRLAIQTIVLAPEKKTLSDYPIAEKKREPVAKGVAESLALIAAMETEESQPIILSIIKDIERLSAGDADTLAFCQLGFYKIWETIELDYAGANAKLSFLAKNKNNILPGLDDLLIKSSAMKCTGPLAKELSLYLQGLYCYFHKQSKEFLASAKDSYVSSQTGGVIPNRLVIGEYYYKYAMKIEQTMQAGSLPLLEANENEVHPFIEPTIENLTTSLVEYENMDENGRILGLKFSLEMIGVPEKLYNKVNSVIIASAKDVLRKYIDELNGKSSTVSWMYQVAKSCVSQNHLLQADNTLALLNAVSDVRGHLLALIDLRNQLYVDGSGNLKPEIDAVLLNAFKLLRGVDVIAQLVAAPSSVKCNV